MLVHPNFDPVALQIGPLAVHWYGLMYVLSFIGVYCLWNYRIKAYPELVDDKWNSETVSDLIFYGALGAVIGGRLGYVLFYKPGFYLSNPFDIVFINQGGMSFHGGLVGVIVALTLFARKINLRFMDVADFVAPVAPLGLFFGRMGNFVNQELFRLVVRLILNRIFSIEVYR